MKVYRSVPVRTGKVTRKARLKEARASEGLARARSFCSLFASSLTYRFSTAVPIQYVQPDV